MPAELPSRHRRPSSAPSPTTLTTSTPACSAKFLREHAVQKLGVRHIADHVDAVLTHDHGAYAGDIAALQTRAHGAVTADLFIDCSGLASMLIGQHFGVPLKSEREVLFNDAALALQIPYATCRCAHRLGHHRHGLGQGLDLGHRPARAARCRRCLLTRARQRRRGPRRTAGLSQCQRHNRPSAARRDAIRFEPGYRERFWVRNCVAIGLSSGFIEPLEASALALVELSAQRLCDELPLSRSGMDAVARRFNDDFGYRWSRVIDFLKLHYALSQRDDSPYWRAHRDTATWPERLRELLPLWKLRPPARHDFGRIDEVFPAASYQYILYGMGFRPDAATPSAVKLQAGRACFDEAARQVRRLVPALPGHRALIQHILQHGLPS